MTSRPFEMELVSEDSLLVPYSESEIIGLLRRAAAGLARLEQSPPQPGSRMRLSSALKAVLVALDELQEDG
jgi:hypothetical protein